MKSVTALKPFHQCTSAGSFGSVALRSQTARLGSWNSAVNCCPSGRMYGHTQSITSKPSACSSSIIFFGSGKRPRWKSQTP